MGISISVNHLNSTIDKKVGKGFVELKDGHLSIELANQISYPMVEIAFFISY